MRRGKAMKKIVLAAAIGSFAGVGWAAAADLPVKAPEIAPIVYNWSGCYLGIEGGGNWGKASETDAADLHPAFVGLPLVAPFNLSGVLAGGTAGCNYQVGTWVFGVEGDLSWTNTNGSANDLPPFNTASTNPVSEKWIDTVRGRVGAAWDRALFYATGGVAFARTDVIKCPIIGCIDDSQTRTGWVAGVGVEYALWQSLSLKIEYLHADLGTGRYIPLIITANGSTDSRDVRFTDDIVRAGLNWRFNWGGPVVARY
jgi:outer membrane immunogenic protein